MRKCFVAAVAVAAMSFASSAQANFYGDHNAPMPIQPVGCSSCQGSQYTAMQPVMPYGYGGYGECADPCAPACPQPCAAPCPEPCYDRPCFLRGFFRCLIDFEQRKNECLYNTFFGRCRGPQPLPAYYGPTNYGYAPAYGAAPYGPAAPCCGQ